ncbi:CD63 antigen [Eurytemora carolleeae]|uniref:CD63 antigen n=1 Tax=Eurytemora carolleeae TaxID=1294199 RepID=UPI000C75F51F|nr:CD63 antigen [Eurytemora carolleeae]|eukprot:XP_023336581.1 CD63 antigen-like [Eurytemora affinis]
MPIVRGSSMMSLGTWKARSTKYQRFLNLSNVFLLITSTILVFSAIILIKFYHITKLNFWSYWFYVNPILMISLGLYTFAVSVYGFLISNQENRCLISMIAVFLGIAFLAQVCSVFSAMEVRNLINNEVIDPSAILEDMQHYGEVGYEAKTASWDEMQKDLRCCGGDKFDTGYQDWRSATIGIQKKSVPDSCCHEMREGCGDQIAKASPSQISLGIYKDGCVAILTQKLKTDVEPMMIVYSCVGVVLAIVELITVVLACAYVAQINRRRKRDELFTRVGNAGAQDEEFLPSLTTKETNF